MDNKSLKTIIQQDNKIPSETQLYIEGMDLLRNDVIQFINPNMSRDYKIEFGYEFIHGIKEFIKQFYKYYQDPDHNQEYIDKIENAIVDVNISLDMLDTLKNNDKFNWVGLTKGQLINIKKNWGKLISQYKKYKTWVQKHKTN